MKTLTSVAAYGLVPIPIFCDGHACLGKDDQYPSTEDANAALLAWYRHLVAERMANEEIAEEERPLCSAPAQSSQPLSEETVA